MTAVGHCRAGYAWHAPYAYNKQKREEYNDFAAGGGLGRSTIDEDGDKHSIYALAFRDSHYKPQYTAGYAWRRWPGCWARCATAASS